MQLHSFFVSRLYGEFLDIRIAGLPIDPPVQFLRWLTKEGVPLRFALFVSSHNNRALMRNKSPRRGGLGSSPFKPRNGSFAVRTQPTQQPEQTTLACSSRQQAPKHHLSPLYKTSDNMVLYLFFSCVVQRQWCVSAPRCTKLPHGSFFGCCRDDIPWAVCVKQWCNGCGEALSGCVLWPDLQQCSWNTEQSKGNMQIDLEQII